MTKSVIFVVTNNSVCSIRRFLMVADMLADMNMKSFLLGSTSEFFGHVKEQAQQLGVQRLPHYISPEIFSSFAPEIQVKLHSTKRTMEDVFIGFPGPQEYSTNNKVGRLLNSLRINSNALMGLHIEEELSRFIKEMRSAERMVEEIKPSCIVHDMELPQKNRAIFYTAQQKNISVISMMHAEGNAEQYDRLPPLSNYYIAYGFYNYEVLRGMGVEENRIFITGVPDTDLVCNYNAEEIKKELTDKYHINFSKKIFLVALRPNVNKAYFDLNTELLDICSESLGSSSLEIVVKQHPIDKYSYVQTDYFKLYTSKYRNMKIIEGDFIISKLFAVSDYFITHKSSAVIEAILQNVSTIVIENDSAKWPDWNRYNVYMPTQIDDIAGFLLEIKKGSYDEKTKNLKADRDEFIRYFRYKFDNQATRRIANAIAEICRNTSKTVVSTEYYRQSSKELFRQGFKCLKRGDALGAIKCFDEVGKDHTPLPGSHFARAIALAQIGKLGIARDACQAELKLQPEHSGVKRLLERIEKAIAECNQLQSSSAEHKV